MNSARYQNIIYYIRFTSNFCQAVFFPFFAVWLFKNNIFSLSNAAIIVSFGIFSTRLAALFFSKMIRQHNKKNIISSILIALSCLDILLFYFSKAHYNNFYIWTVLSIAIGAILSINSISILGYITQQHANSKYKRNFSLINIALNLSSGIGPFLGSLIISYNSNYFPLLPVAFALITIILTLFLTNDVRNKNTPDPCTSQKITLGGKKYRFLLVLNFFTMIGYAQFYDVFPVYASRYVDPRLVGLLFVLSSIVIVLFQMPITNFLQKFKEINSICSTNVVLAVGTVLFIGVSHHHLLFCSILGVILISLAEVGYVPIYQTIAVRDFQPKNSVLSLAILSFIWGIAESIASYLGIYFVGQNIGYVSFIIGSLAPMIVVILYFVSIFINFSEKKKGQELII